MTASKPTPANQRSRNSALLYRNRRPKSASSPKYLGVIVTDTGHKYWVGAWAARSNNEPAIEIRLMPKTEKRGAE
jgi:hypothetical protein